MKALIKWILIVIAAIVLLLVIAAVVLPLTFDPNNYKDEIRQAVKKETGRELTMTGEIGWTVFPVLGLEVNDVALGNREGFGNEPMLIIGQAGASVKIMPLFSKKVEIGKVTLKDMSVNLSQKANGQNNWDDLSDSETPDSSGQSTGGESDIQSIHISGIEISNTNVRWDDAGQVTELKNFNLNASGIANQEPFDLDGGFSVSLQDPQMTGDAEFSGHVIPAGGTGDLRIEGLKLSFNGQHGAAPDSFDVDLSISTDATINDAKDSAKLDNFELRLHNMKVSGTLAVASLSDDPTLKGVMTVADFNPKSLMKALGIAAPATSNADALTHFSAQMNFTGSANGTHWRDLKMKLDQSNMNGRFQVSNFDQPELDFDLAIDSINLDDYLPPADESGPTIVNSSPAAKPPPGKGQAGASESDLTSETFRGLNGGGTFKIGQLKIADMTATNVSTTMSANSKGWRFYPTVASFYGGTNKSDIRIDATGSRPILTLSEDLSGVQAEGLLADLTGKASRLLGTGAFMLNIETDLSNSATIRNALNGDLSMSIADGAFIGIDVADTIGQAKSLLGKQDESSEQLDNDAKTEFALLGMTGLIKNGILSSDDFDMSSTLMRASGKGQINLINETIDYVVKPVLSENVRGKGKSTLGKLSGVPIPIKISGSLYDPKISIDFVGAITESQKAKIDAKKTELTNKLFEKLLGDDKDKKSATEGEKGQTPDAQFTDTDVATGTDTSTETDAGTDSGSAPPTEGDEAKAGNTDTETSEDPVDTANQPENAPDQPEGA